MATLEKNSSMLIATRRRALLAKLIIDREVKNCHEPKKIRIEAPRHLLPRSKPLLNEQTYRTVGKYTARRDQPHFHGDSYHAHVEFPGGYEVSWNASGSRRHPNKFPTNVPHDVKAAAAKVLGVKIDLLETFTIMDNAIGENVWLFEYKHATK